MECAGKLSNCGKKAKAIQKHTGIQKYGVASRKEIE
jgi:hypothetical protein